MKKLRISILIISKKFTDKDVAPVWAKNLLGLDCDFEILCGEGDNPSLQRNRLAEEARGDYLLFLDDDSEPDSELLIRYCTLIRQYPEAVIFGGPSLLKSNGQLVQSAQKIFFSSSFGIGPFRGRYNSVGKTRPATEKELILSNVLIQREFFISTGGFNKELHPGEENEFLKRQKSADTVYCPDTKIYRYPRETLNQFYYQMFSYGNGRAKHLGFSPGELMLLLPAVFSIYLSVFLFLSTSFWIPVAFYIVIIGAVIILNARAFFKLYPCIFLTFLGGHFFYGIGIMAGLVKRFLFKRSRGLTYLNITRLKEFII